MPARFGQRADQMCQMTLKGAKEAATLGTRAHERDTTTRQALSLVAS